VCKVLNTSTGEKQLAEDFYRTLGVSRDATDKEIRDAYRKLARQLHPDVNPEDKSAAERFKKVNQAHEVLGDSKKRKDYDEFGENWKHADELRKAGHSAFAGGGRGFGGFNPGGGESVFDFFGGNGGSSIFDLFGGGQPQGKTSVQGVIDVTLEDAFNGVSRRVNISGPKGSRTLEVLVPAGIQDGGRVRLNPDPQTEVLLTVRVAPHRVFTRSGDDLHVDARVSYLDAILGGEAEVPTMTGKVALKIPARTQNGRSFRIPGKGMPGLNSGRFGDLIATVNVRLPGELGDDQKKLFEQLRELDRKSTAQGGRR
jgi:DnaJ-class molecular chaperone